MRLTYVMAFVDDMDAATRFHRDVLHLPLRFQSPGWTEFDTGDVTLALHGASPERPHGTLQLGLATDDLEAFVARAAAHGVRCTRAPAPLHGTLIATFADVRGVEFTVSAPLSGAARPTG
jgi:lactoylglutathione lyase